MALLLARREIKMAQESEISPRRPERVLAIMTAPYKS